MQYKLKLHPDYSAAAVTELSVTITRQTASRLAIHYALVGDLSTIRMAPQVTSTRGFELWRHTCFELFLRAPNQPAYYEFNFSPSTEWTAHRFSDRRTGVVIAEDVPAPTLRVEQQDNRYDYFVGLDLTTSTLVRADDDWQLAITTVVEDNAGQQSFWALAHAPGKPDFHNPDNFLCTVAAPADGNRI